jgi:hypothetical protein
MGEAILNLAFYALLIWGVVRLVRAIREPIVAHNRRVQESVIVHSNELHNSVLSVMRGVIDVFNSEVHEAKGRKSEATETMSPETGDKERARCLVDLACGRCRCASFGDTGSLANAALAECNPAADFQVPWGWPTLYRADMNMAEEIQTHVDEYVKSAQHATSLCMSSERRTWTFQDYRALEDGRESARLLQKFERMMKE